MQYRNSVARRPALDGAIPLVVLLGVPLLAPIVGIEIRRAVYAIALLFLGFAAAMAAGGANRQGEPPLAWRLYAVAAGSFALTVSATGVLVISDSDPRGALLAAGLPLLVLMAGLIVHLRSRLSQGFRPEIVVEALPGLIAAPALVIPFVLIPGYDHGDALLTGVAGGALLVFCLAAVLAGGGRRAQDARVGRTLSAMTAAVLGATALVAMKAAGDAHGVPALEFAAALYAVAGWLLTSASVAERPQRPLAS